VIKGTIVCVSYHDEATNAIFVTGRMQGAIEGGVFFAGDLGPYCAVSLPLIRLGAVHPVTAASAAKDLCSHLVFSVDARHGAR
jgi:hypothetical protein